MVKKTQELLILFIEVANVPFEAPRSLRMGEGGVHMKINFSETIFVGIGISVNIDHLQLA